MTVADLIVRALATWRVANILISERGPFDAFTTIREYFGVAHSSEDDGREPVGFPSNSVFSCMYCMSVWVGFAFAILPNKVARPFAFSAIAVIVKEWLDGTR